MLDNTALKHLPPKRDDHRRQAQGCRSTLIGLRDGDGGSGKIAVRSPRRGWLRRPRPRKIWLYDTFEGMTAPTERDVDLTGTAAATYMAGHSDAGRWCYADEADVRKVMALEGFGPGDIEIVKGDVVQTLRTRRPNLIALLRLDTDWYESTRAELEVLYPRLSRGGVLIIDDYGHWEGARQAVDEFFAREPGVLLHRISYAVRVAVKV
jgi:hypothetical protein